MSQHKPQQYGNHKKITPMYHFVLVWIAALVLIASIVNLASEKVSFTSILLVGVSVCVAILVLLLRQFATTLQDRIIRQEESFRHFRLTGKPLDARLSMKQIIALRFAEDDEFPSLCSKAAETGTAPDQIKKSITRWRADHHRV